MTESDKPQFARMLAKLATVYQRHVDEDLVDTYFLAMKPFSIPAIQRACQSAVEDYQWFPKPVDLRGLAHEPERYDVLDDARNTVRCLKCHDKAVVLSERIDEKGRNLGTFAAPCSCEAGQRRRASWEKPNSVGHVFAESAKDNTVSLRKLGAR